MSTFSERLTDAATRLYNYSPEGEVEEISRELLELANELEGYWLDEREGEFPTPRQALALGRFMRMVMRDEQHERNPQFSWAKVSRGGAGLGPDYLLVDLGDGYQGGIDREGRTST